MKVQKKHQVCQTSHNHYEAQQIEASQEDREDRLRQASHKGVSKPEITSEPIIIKASKLYRASHPLIETQIVRASRKSQLNPRQMKRAISNKLPIKPMRANGEKITSNTKRADKTETSMLVKRAKPAKKPNGGKRA